MFNVHMLCAGHGDCLWMEYGNDGDTRRILVDAGTPATYESALLPRIEEVIAEEGRCVFELFVVTHIDADHIGGALRFLDELDKRKVKIKEIWFNGYFHLSNETPSELGPDQAERLTELIRRGGWPWNKRFKRYAVMVPDAGPLPSFTYAGMKLTLLSPTFDRLQKLKPTWEKVIQKAGLVPGLAYAETETVMRGGFLGADVASLAEKKFTQDKAPANGTSIAFLAEFDGKRVLFGADAFPSVLLESLKRAPFNGKCPVDAFKLPHHASRGNVSLPLLEACPTKTYLVSTNGDHFGHPDPEAIARVLVGNSTAKRLLFNYKTTYTQDWNDAAHKRTFKYTTRYGTEQGLILEL